METSEASFPSEFYLIFIPSVVDLVLFQIKFLITFLSKWSLFIS